MTLGLDIRRARRWNIRQGWRSWGWVLLSKLLRYVLSIDHHTQLTVPPPTRLPEPFLPLTYRMAVKRTQKLFDVESPCHNPEQVANHNTVLTADEKFERGCVFRRRDVCHTPTWIQSSPKPLFHERTVNLVSRNVDRMSSGKYSLFVTLDIRDVILKGVRR